MYFLTNSAKNLAAKPALFIVHIIKISLFQQIYVEKHKLIQWNMKDQGFPSHIYLHF